MRKVILSTIILSFLALPILSGCESKQLKDENAKLKQQVDMLSKEKMAMQTQSTQLTAQMDDLKKQIADLQKENTDLKAKMASGKKPAAAKPVAKKTTKKK